MIFKQAKSAILAGALLLSSAAPAFAGAWIVTDTFNVTRAYDGQGVYSVEISFQVRRSPNETGNAQKLPVTFVVSEDDGCWATQAFKGQTNICIPLPGATTPIQTRTYYYPCSWGDDVRVEILNQQAFTGIARTFWNLPLIGEEECGPSVPVGHLVPTPELLGDSELASFFGVQNPNDPLLVMTQSFDGTTGTPLLELQTGLLPDPLSLGYDFYETHIFTETDLLLTAPIPSAGNAADPLFLPDPLMLFGDPTGLLALPLLPTDLDLVRDAVLLLIDADEILPPLPILAGGVQPLPDEMICRFGNLNLQNGPLFDALLVNGSTGDEFRVVEMTPSDSLAIDFLEFPGVTGPYPYALFAFLGEAGPLDLAPQPLGIGTACFSTPLTGGDALTLLNVLGHEALLGSPLIPATPLAPGPVLDFTRPNGFPALELTLQALVPDNFSPNGQAGLTNAVVLRIRD